MSMTMTASARARTRGRFSSLARCASISLDHGRVDLPKCGLICPIEWRRQSTMNLFMKGPHSAARWPHDQIESIISHGDLDAVA